MKRIAFILLVLFAVSNAYAAPISTTPYVSPDDVTIPNLESNRTTLTNAINSFDGGLIQAETITADSLDNNANPEKRWYDSFNSFVITGLLPPTSTDLDSTTTAGRALIEDTANIKMKYVEKDATSHTYTASKYTYVDLGADGTYTYSETAIGAAEPTTTANSIRLALVSTDTTKVNTVTDKRVTTISLATNEDQYRTGLTISVATPDTITVLPGFLNHGTTTVSKTAATSLVLGTATDWAGGVSGRTTSDYGFVVVDSEGNIKLTTTEPTYTDTNETTAGKLRYSTISSTSYRYIGWFYMNTTGSGNIDGWGYSNFKDGDAWSTINVSSDLTATNTSTSYVYVNNLTADVYTTGNPIYCMLNLPVKHSQGNYSINAAIEVDNIEMASTMAEPTPAEGQANAYSPISLSWFGYIGQGTHTVKAKWKTEGGTATSSTTEGIRSLIIMEQ